MKKWILLAAALTLGSAAQADGYLTIGDAAPSLSGVTWLKGKLGPTTGKVYVVEFWATWCGPCKENIPNLTKLAKQYAGQVEIAGIDIWETTDKRDTTYQSRVADFVKKQGGKMDYIVGVDNMSSQIANGWMKSAGEGGIPMSFVIGKDGKIAWMGHAQGLEEVLPKVLDGSFNVQSAREKRATEVEAIRPVKEALDDKQYAKALTLIDQIVAKRPNMSRYYDYDRYSIFAHIDLPQAKTMSEKLIKDTNGEIGIYQMMSSVYASQADLSPEAYAFGMSLIQEALAKKDREYLFLSMAGAVSMFQHDRPKAIDYAKQAVAAAEKDSHAPAPFVEFLKRNVTTYETGK